MSRRRSLLRLLLVCAVVVAAGSAAGLVAMNSVPGLRWRRDLVWRKATGALPDVDWAGVAALIKPGSGVWPELIADTGSPYWSIQAPAPTASDLDAGQALFQTHCASCHGPSAEGGTAGEIVSGQFRHGAGDWALFRTIREGVPGTAMPASNLDADATWQVVSWLKNRVLEASGHAAPRAMGSAPELPGWREVTAAELAGAGADGEWLTFSGSYDGTRHSTLAEIDRANVSGLRLQWIYQLPSEGDPALAGVPVARPASDDVPLAVTPLVVGDTMFVNVPVSEVRALDARTGEVIWSHAGPPPPPDITSMYGLVNSGMAVLDHRLFVTRIDARLQALDARDGRVLWTTEVADYHEGYSIVGAPLAIDGAVIVGVAGSDRGVRGFLDAYSAETGERLWRFYTVPGPGETGHETWGATDAWQRGGGVTPTTGTYDPDLGLIYWGVGNPTPAFQGDVRPGDNLFTSSVIAVDAKTGELRWHYQVVPHDEYEWGVTQTPVLADIERDGVRRAALYLATRNGFFYTLDRATGEFLAATPFVHQTWNDGFDEHGRPRVRPNAHPIPGGTLIFPGHSGATNRSAPSFDPDSRLLLVVTRAGYANLYYSSHRLFWDDGAYWGGRAGRVSGTASASEVRAIDTTTGTLRWTYRFPGAITYTSNGVLTTAGGLAFVGDKGRFVALDSETGEELWHFITGGTIDAAPITYRAGGRQAVTIAAGRTLLTFARERP